MSVTSNFGTKPCFLSSLRISRSAARLSRRRWTNDRFLATPHRAVNRTGGERYALAFFCDAQIDWPIAAVPTCVGPRRPPRYETTYYTDYMIGYQARTYNVFDDQAKDAAK